MFFETVESRTFLDGTVTEIYPGIYNVAGTSADEVMYVQVSMQERTFTLDNQTYTNVSYIIVQGNGGCDMITVTSGDGAGGIACSVVGGPDSDYINLNFDGGVWGGAGGDELVLTDSFRGQVYAQDGDDLIYVCGDSVDAEIQGGDGDDTIDCTYNNYRVVVHAGAGNDTVYGTLFDDQLYGDGGDDCLYGGDGDDSFYAASGSGGEIAGGEGYDIIYADGYQGATSGVEEVIGA
jgi:hypothetical protein